MTTDRQCDANRRNAQKSTGPRSASGRAASSGNARRHGLTGALDHDAVLSWYRVILDDATAVLDPFERDPYRRAAANLARAEAHLQRVLTAEEQWLRESQSPLSEEQDFVESRERVVDALMDDTWKTDIRSQIPTDEQELLPSPQPLFGEEEYFMAMEAFIRRPLVKVGWDPTGFRILRRLERTMARAREKRLALHDKAGRTLARYRASAEARRRTALRRWITEFAKRSQLQLKVEYWKEDERPLPWDAIPPSGLPSPKGVQ